MDLPKPSRNFVVAIASLFLLVSGVGCAGGEEESDEEPTQQQTKEEDKKKKKVVLYEYRFNPNSLTIQKGTTVEFYNKDKEKHNVKIGALDIDKNLPSGETFTHTFETTGEFAVENRLSDDPMKMTITVEK